MGHCYLKQLFDKDITMVDLDVKDIDNIKALNRPQSKKKISISHCFHLHKTRHNITTQEQKAVCM